MRGAGKSSSMAALNAARQAGSPPAEGPASGSPRRGGPAVLLAAGLALLMVSWVFANPPGAAPDERAHYVRALGAGSLELAGDAFHPTPEQSEAFLAQRNSPNLTGAGLATVLWAAKQTRTFALPADLSVFAFGCNDQKVTESAACVDHPTGPRSQRLPTYTGTYPPWAYIVPGRVMRAEHTPNAALRAGRLVSAAICFLLLAAAIALVGAGPGLAIALTPMVVYCATILNASGTEIAGSLCFIAAGLHIQRRGAWLALAAGGAALALSRSLGPVLLLVLGATLVLLNGRRGRPNLAALRCSPSPSRCRRGGTSRESPHGVEGGPSYGQALKQTFHDLDDVARHAVGDFGALDTTLPTWLYVAWGLAAVGLLVLAAVRGSWRERAGLALCVVVAGAITVAVSVFQLRTGYGAQGRHVLPALVLPALYAGEVLRGRIGAVAARRPRGSCGPSGRRSRGLPTRAARRSGPTARGGRSAPRSGRRRWAGRRGWCSPRSGSGSRSPALRSPRRAVIGAAAAAQQPDRRQLLAQRRVVAAERHGVALVELLASRRARRGSAPTRSPAGRRSARAPGAVEPGSDVRRVRAVDHEELGRPAGRAVDPARSPRRRRAVRQPSVRLDREAGDHRHAGGHRACTTPIASSG